MRLIVFLCVLGALGPQSVATQVRTGTDTITGRVTGPTGRPVVGAIVEATSVTTRASRSQATDARGQFTMLFPERGAPYDLTVRYYGLVPAWGTPPRWTREDRRAAKVRMELAGLRDPISRILRARHSLRLSPDQVNRLEEIGLSLQAQRLTVSDAWILGAALERVRSLLTAYQWAGLCETMATAGSRPPPSPVASAQPAPPQPTAPAPQSVSLYTGLTTVYETNLDHAPLGSASYGVLAGVGGEYHGRWSGTTLELQYDGVFRRYSATDLWNRPGHQATLSLTRRLARHWAVGAEAEVQLNGSAEDRVLRNEYGVRPELEYRLSRATRVQLYGEYVLKRYPNPAGRNSVDPRVGVKLRQALGDRGAFGMGARYDYNHADSSRYRYVGWTAYTDLAFPVGPAGRISSSVRYGIRRYTSRLVDIGTSEVLRRDSGLVATIALRQEIHPVGAVVFSYRYEKYKSNDTRREFLDHLLALTFTRSW